MKTSRVIVAINEDTHAPMLKHAHYGIVGDLFQCALLTEKVRRRSATDL